MGITSHEVRGGCVFESIDLIFGTHHHTPPVYPIKYSGCQDSIIRLLRHNMLIPISHKISFQ
ncbi:hypothetical protein SLEP1_g14876 [Rubroshorea leprosula]|uniref:Uncharacterized protein n=1 Tax=Rubroshorea leprosula TaxID=152421 RepID=A0AAV5IPY7_9ROSI|nr:hypothetical protein SLEP1_g14876 [Rubroshorea leprosula]